MKKEFKQLLNDEEGLTLVELLATIIILAVIAGISAVAITKVMQRTREDAAVSNIQQTLDAAELYALANPEVASFTVKDVIDEGNLKKTACWINASPTSSFTQVANGELEMKLDANELAAGKKKNKAVAKLTEDEIAALKRSTIFD
ncbi:MAG: prepilin-type N-terminal cleavage/methylation domain-containing protein [Lactobacillales bacterium]|jgi:type IV pilus assembly protein PilA|nr:prepilin-type N-terminal cleavage/methylation domain-containing protein [Lactobacillales bacterium]